MARIRTVKPEFWKHERLSELPEATHMLAAALLNYSDDEGYFNANPKLIQGECFPLRELSVSIPESLRLLSAEGYLRLGRGSDGKRYGHIVHFSAHQKISHPSASKIKAVETSWEDSRKPPGILREDSGLKGTGNREGEQGTGKGDRSLRSLNVREEKNSDVGKAIAVAEPVDLTIPDFLLRKPEHQREFEERFWPAYPHKVGKPAALKAFIRTRKTNALAAIVAGLDRYIAGKPADHHWLNPATFLNQERFNDEPAAAVQRSRNGLDALGSALAAVADQIHENEETDREVKRISSPH